MSNIEIKPRTLPSINIGDDIDIKVRGRVVVQEKIDGSQCTLFRRNDELICYNKKEKMILE